MYHEVWEENFMKILGQKEIKQGGLANFCCDNNSKILVAYGNSFFLI